MQASKNAVDLIKRFEGLTLTAKNHGDSNTDNPLYTVGYGHTRSAYEGMVISVVEAENLLLKDIEEAEIGVLALVTAPLNQNQFDALVSFVFNVGSSQFASSTLLHVINSGDYSAACLQFSRWVYDNGKALNGLVSRRAAECELFSRSMSITPIDKPDNQTRLTKKSREITPSPIRQERDSLKQSRTVKAGSVGIVSVVSSVATNRADSFIERVSWLPDVLAVIGIIALVVVLWCRRDDFLRAKS